MNSAARGLTIGRAGERERLQGADIRFCEQIGILVPPARSEGNQRLYSDADPGRLCFVRHCRDLAFSLEAVCELLSLADHPDRPCVAADQIVETHLREVERRIEGCALSRRSCNA